MVNQSESDSGCGATPDGRSLRRSVYVRMFGEPAEILEDPDSNASLDVAVHIYPPGHGDREFYTLITDGMSDRPMEVPKDLAVARRAELVMYVDAPGPSVVELLRTIAKIPFSSGMWLGHGHTLPNGDPPQPLFPGSLLSTLLVLQTIVSPERHTDEHMSLDGDPLNILWLMPITTEEATLKVVNGMTAFLDLCNREQLSFVFDPGRPSLC